MKIAVASQNEADITKHAGHCLKFWIYEIDLPTVQDKYLLQLTPDQTFHATSACDPHALDDVNVLIGGSMGSGLARRLKAKGITPIVTPETDPDAAVAAYLVGSLVTGIPEEHDHPHDHKGNHESIGECQYSAR